MKLLLVCLVLLGCTINQVSTSEQIHLMKRLLRALEDEREETIENGSKYLKCSQYVHECLPVFSLTFLRHVARAMMYRIQVKDERGSVTQKDFQSI